MRPDPFAVPVTLQSPGTRKIYRVGRSLFRVWVTRPDATAELYRDGEWVFTSIPSGAILSDAQAARIEDADELRALGIDPASTDLDPREPGSDRSS